MVPRRRAVAPPSARSMRTNVHGPLSRPPVEPKGDPVLTGARRDFLGSGREGRWKGQIADGARFAPVSAPDAPMEWEALVASVSRFGLSPREAALYLSLLRRGRASASELAREIRIDRVLGYRVLDSMRARGIVETTAERPRRYAAVAPAAILERVLRERRRSLQDDERAAKDLSERLAPLARTLPGAGTRYQVLVGERRVYDYLREMIERASAEICVMMTHRSLRESLAIGLQERLGPFLRAGGRFRMLVEAHPQLQQLARRFGRTLRRFPHAEIRQRPELSIRMTIIDQSEALVFVVPDAHDRRSQQVAIWADSASFVSGQRLHFEALWKDAPPVPSVPRVARRTAAVDR
jgi:HTH-type transcriptional regulator, sugar sensing transcriptional regulator